MNDFNRIAISIRLHNRIHQEKEPNSVLISEYLEMAADLFDKIADGDIQIVKHGRWENEYFENVWWADCTNCKETTLSRYCRVSSYPFCPHCGAKMDLKEDKDGKE